MRLVENWRRVLLRAWSVRLMLAAMVIEIANALPAAGDVVPDWLGLLFLIAAPMARVIQQESVKE